MRGRIKQINTIPVFKPSYGTHEIKAIAKVINSGWIGQGPVTEEFEKRFAEYIGTRYAVAVNAGTAALHLALKTIGVDGYEVITTPMTFIATNHAILYNGGRLVFCDISSDTLNIDISQIQKLVTSKTRAIMVVHYGGHACDMDALKYLARKNRLVIIEDCAHACGGEYKGRKLGATGDLGCFSFQAVKNLSTGDGGMITTNNPRWYKQLKRLRWMGITKDTWTREKKRGKFDWKYTVADIGFKYNMNDLSAALGIVQLGKLDQMNKRRAKIARHYSQGLKDLPLIEKPVEKEYTQSSWHNYVIKLSKRNKLNLFLQSRGISSGVHYFPNHLYPVYRCYYRRLPVAERIWQKVLTLPLYPDLPLTAVNRIIACIREFYGNEYPE